ncbi:DDE-type integrase/transposase/recombinase, partial [Mammaliicoccus sp. D-M17]
MKQRNLVSTYTKMKFKVTSSKVNQSTTKNHLNRNFKKHKQYKYIVSDLTYVRVDNRWHYVCLFSDLYNREIIGYSVGQRKNADLVFKALASIETNLFNISYIHTDRGREFDNQLIDKVIDVFNINRSLSRKGNPYDNAVA